MRSKTGKTAFKANILALAMVFLAVPAFGATVSSFTCSTSVETSADNYVSDNASGDLPGGCFISAGNGGANASANAFTEIGGITAPPPPYGTGVFPVDSTVYGDDIR